MIKTILTNSSQFPQIGESSGPTIQPQSKKSRKGIIVLIFVILLIFSVTGTGLALALRIWDPLWNPFRPSPEKVMQEMASRMKEANTFHSDINVLASGEDKNMGKQEFSLNIKGDSDINDKDNPKISETINFGFKTGQESFNMEGSMNGDIRIIGKNYYFKINSFPAVDQILGFLKIDSSKIIGQWFKAEYPDSEEKINENIEKSKNYILDNKIYVFKKEFNDEKINGKEVYHYQFVLDGVKIKEFLSKEYKLSNKELDEIGEINVDFWIGKKDLLLYKMEFEKNINASGENVFIKFSMNLSDIDKSVLIEEPKDAKNLSELLK